MKTVKKSILISGIRLPIRRSEEDALKEARRRLRGVHLLSSDTEFSVFRRSVDARKRDDIAFAYTVLASGSFPEDIFERSYTDISPMPEELPEFKEGSELLLERPLIVGAGPAGLFAALLLAENGYRPILIERGGSVKERREATEIFIKTRVLDTECNIQFGAGGAGTFSDGKLVTRVKDPISNYILRRFVEFGAPKEILKLAKPHIGTDILSTVVENMISRIESAGGEVRYHTCLTDIGFRDGKPAYAITNTGEIPFGALILAVGHSARDTYRMLLSRGFSIEPKAYSVGMRIEHLSEDIDRAMYGDLAGDPVLGHAEYNLSYNTKVRGVYTFCMCPGGEVVAATSLDGGVVTNGMSRHARDGKNANSAVLCSVFKEDYGATVEGAISFQEKIERAAFLSGGGDFSAPMVTVGDFLEGRCKNEPSRVMPTYMNGGVRLASPESYLPDFAVKGIRNALCAFDAKIKGFAARDAVLTGAETRSSSPVRILRTPDRYALGMPTVYPVGEGAGYAGGITSAAIDGVRTAIALIEKYKP